MLTAILAVVLLVMAAMVVDLGIGRDVRRQAQAAADASALAGASALYPPGLCTSGAKPCFADAVAAVKTYAQQNFKVTAADWTSCIADAAHPALSYVVAGESPCISFDSSAAPRTVQVYLPPRVVKTSFGALAGVSSIPIRSFAQAQFPAMTCALCFLGPVHVGNADFNVNGGSVAVNGDVSVGPNSNWTATSIGVVGGETGGHLTPSPTPIPAFTDPLTTSLTLPPDTTGLPASPRTNPCAGAAGGGGPGFYASSVDLPNNATCSLQPGLYVISNTWSMGNNSVLSSLAGGVTLYVTSSGALDFKNGSVAITAQTTGTLAGYAIVYARNNTNPLGLQGNGGTSITGMVYAPAAALDFNGNSCFGFNGGPVIVYSVQTANGNHSCVNISGATDTTSAYPAHLSK
ncbi:MAG: DUF7305 domain-containing protein [Mycobacteriaceae bacterium]